MMENISLKSKVIFMCGAAGSGKTTYAKILEQQGYSRLSFDEESFKRGYRVHPLPKVVYDKIKSILDKELHELIVQNRNIVLDYSFWSRQMRNEYKDKLIPFGIKPKIILIVTPKEIAIQRIKIRKGNHPNDIILDDQMAKHYYEHFQRPTADEGDITVVKGY